MNMNLIKKLHAMDIGVVTAESVSRDDIAIQTQRLYKPPFWYFAREYYGAAVSLYKNRLVDGFIYVSAFSCGVDSVVIELIMQETDSFPFMVLKIDEHTGEAAVDTRIEAYCDMLKRRVQLDYYRPTDGQHLPCRQGVF
jgi:predicted nucleotide-binding protein (sugar kinase/HSP70/actin superfamily)